MDNRDVRMGYLFKLMRFMPVLPTWFFSRTATATGGTRRFLKTIGGGWFAAVLAVFGELILEFLNTSCHFLNHGLKFSKFLKDLVDSLKALIVDEFCLLAIHTNFYPERILK